jgi:two-component system sensor histidine kinase HydH
MKNGKFNLFLLIAITTATLALHYYGVLFEGIFGHSHLIHVIHARLCYIPIVLGAVWFGLRGGMITAVVISFFAFMYIILKPVTAPMDLISEYTEIAFYLAIGGMAGILIDRERSSMRKKEEAERKLQHAERLSLMGQMTASIAHEIKNPLGSIKGAAQILKADNLSADEKREFADIIEKETDRLNHVVTDFLSYARPTPTNLIDVDISEILNSAHKQLRYQARQQNILIEIEQNRMPVIKADPDKLRQVILNIMLNSFQAMPEGGKLSVSCRLLDQKPKQVELEMADSGHGISSADIAKIFDPFFSTKSRGSGLGLATTQAIINEHKGRIRAESKEGKGTKFIITLPVSDGED